MALITDGLHEPDLLLSSQLDDAKRRGLFKLAKLHNEARKLVNAFSVNEPRCPETGNINVGWTNYDRLKAVRLLRGVGIEAVARCKLDNDRSPERQALRGIRSGEVRREKRSLRDVWIIGMRKKGHSFARIMERLPHRFDGKSLSRMQIYRIIRRDSEGVDTSRRKIAPKDWVRLPLRECFRLIARARLLDPVRKAEWYEKQRAEGKMKCNTYDPYSERGKRIPAGKSLPQAVEGRRRRVFNSAFARLMMRINHHCEPEAAKWAVNDAHQLENRPLKEGDLRRIAGAVYLLALKKWPVTPEPKPVCVTPEPDPETAEILAGLMQGLGLSEEDSEKCCIPQYRYGAESTAALRGFKRKARRRSIDRFGTKHG